MRRVGDVRIAACGHGDIEFDVSRCRPREVLAAGCGNINGNRRSAGGARLVEFRGLHIRSDGDGSDCHGVIDVDGPSRMQALGIARRQRGSNGGDNGVVDGIGVLRRRQGQDDIRSCGVGRDADGVVGEFLAGSSRCAEDVGGRGGESVGGCVSGKREGNRERLRRLGKTECDIDAVSALNRLGVRAREGNSGNVFIDDNNFPIRLANRKRAR